MAQYRRSSIVGSIVLIGIGVLFLYSNSHPSIDPWYLLVRYWPLLLIFAGLGKLWDYLYHQSGSNNALITGGEVVALILVVLFFVALGHHHARHNVFTTDHQTIDYGNASSANVDIQMPAGDLQVSGGAAKLLDADLNYNQAFGAPQFSYNVDAGESDVVIRQPEQSNIHFEPFGSGGDNHWNVRLGNNVPMELKIEIGAGRGRLDLGSLPLTKLNLQMGAGSVTADLRGNWKNDLDAHIQGGVGSATILLPKNVGVEIHANGGIGSVNAHGLQKDGDRYVNDAYGKSPVTLELNIQGGIGSIDLRPET